ncbi:MAG: SsrA-binding protein SmpB [Spirochaetota bacterium]
MSDGIKILQKNKKAYFNFEIVETLECGIVLEGTEVKTLRQGKFSFGDAYVRIKKGELVLIGFHIAPYSFGSINNHEPDRDRILLASKQEIKKLRRKVEEKGNTLVPTKIYLKNSLIKVEVATARGRKMHDKRNAIRDRDLKRDAERSMKRY